MPQVLQPVALPLVVLIAASLSGCTSVHQYVQNGFKVGPNFCPPQACTAEHWIDTADLHVQPDPEELRHWWTLFNDPVLNCLVADACRQNLSLREAGFRVLQARAEVGIAAGNLFPQQQGASGDYTRQGSSAAMSGGGGGKRFSDQWNFGFQLAWELDFWGRFRRALDAADARLDASVADYDQVLVTLLGDVAENYTQVRTLQERIELVEANVKLQQRVLDFIQKRFAARFKVTELDLDQAESNLAQTQAAIPLLQTSLRLATNRLCILLGRPPADLEEYLGRGSIPHAPPEVVLGIPAELLRRRPDVRRAEREAAAQAEMIGIVEADLYPTITLDGTLGYSARNFADLFSSKAFRGNVGPSFQWNLLNYGRIVNDMRYQDARFRELLVAYQNVVLQANEEVENGLVTFLRAQQRTRLLDASVEAARKAVKIVVAQYENGAVDFNRYATIEQNLVVQQDSAAQARGEIVQGLIQVYRALGGGWEIRLAPAEPSPLLPAVVPEEQP